MKDLPSIIRLIQGEIGVERDSKFGPVTAAAVLAALQHRHLDFQDEKTAPATTAESFEFDERSEKFLALLDPKAVPVFRNFLALSKGVAASFGCDYRLISSLRTWEEQDALFAQRPQVTRARGGYSWHNFGIAGDFGVFVGSTYFDGGSATQQVLAERIHKACSLNAESCGLAWGGNWKSIKDTPHFQLASFPDSPTAAHRATYKAKGSVL